MIRTDSLPYLSLSYKENIEFHTWLKMADHPGLPWKISTENPIFLETPEFQVNQDSWLPYTLLTMVYFGLAQFKSGTSELFWENLKLESRERQRVFFFWCLKKEYVFLFHVKIKWGNGSANSFEVLKLLELSFSPLPALALCSLLNCCSPSLSSHPPAPKVPVTLLSFSLGGMS